MDSQELGTKFGGTRGKKIGTFREQFILGWIARWRYSTPDVLAIALNISVKSAKDKLSKMLKRQLIRKIPTFTKNNCVYILTHHGESEFRLLSNKAIPTRLDASKLKTNSMINHDAAVQCIIAQKWATRSITQFLTQFDIKQGDINNNLPTLPDALVVSKNGIRTAIEFEATQKSERRILGKFFDLRKDQRNVQDGVIDMHHQAMQRWMKNNNTAWEYVEYTTLTNGFADTYQKHINTYYNRRFKDQKNDDGKLIKEGWVSSFIINPTSISDIIKEVIYEHSRTEDSLRNLL